MSSLLQFTQGANVGADGESLIGTLGDVTCSIVGATGTAREFRLNHVPFGPDAAYLSALPLGPFGTGTTATLPVDAYGTYRVELWVDTGAGLELADVKVFTAEDPIGVIQIPDTSRRAQLNYAGNGGHGHVFAHARNQQKLRDAAHKAIVIGFTPAASRPVVPGVGHHLWEKDDNKLYWWNGTTSIELGSGSGGGPIVIENSGPGVIYDGTRDGLTLRNATPGALGADQSSPMLVFEAGANSTGTPSTMAWGWQSEVYGSVDPQQSWLALYLRGPDGNWGGAGDVTVARFYSDPANPNNGYGGGLYVNGDLGGNTGSFGSRVLTYVSNGGGAGTTPALPAYSILDSISAEMGGLYRISDTIVGMAAVGAEVQRWASGATTVKGNILFDAATRDIGSRATYVEDLYAHYVGLKGGSPSNYIEFSTGANQVEIIAGKTLHIDSTHLTFNGPSQLAGTITSGTPSTYDLGATGDRWATAYVGTLDATAISVAGAVTATSVVSSGTITGTVTDTNAASIVNVSTIKHLLSSGTAAAGIGTAQLYQTQNASGTTVSAGQVAAALKVATAGSEQSYFRWQTLDGTGALADSFYGWAASVGIGTGTTAPRGTLDIKTPSSSAAAQLPLVIDKNNSAVAANYLASFQLAGVEKASIRLDASNNLLIVVGSRTWNLTTGGQFGSSPTMANLASDLISANYIVGSYTSATGGIELTGAGNVCNLYSDIYSGGANGASFKLDRNGATLAQVARAATGTTDPRGLRLTPAALTAITQATNFQFFDVGTATWTWANTSANHVANVRWAYIQAPVLSFANNTGSPHFTAASTLALSGPPVIGSFGSITEAFTLALESGAMCIEANAAPITADTVGIVMRNTGTPTTSVTCDSQALRWGARGKVNATTYGQQWNALVYGFSRAGGDADPAADQVDGSWILRSSNDAGATFTDRFRVDQINTTIMSALKHTGTKVGLYSATPVTQGTVAGSRGGNAALADLLTKLAATGIVVDGTSA